MTIDICLSPVLYPSYQKENDTVIVVDVFRATTTMCVAFNNGAEAIIPIADINLAKKYKSEGFLVGAERKTRRVEFADFGNSPFEYTKEKVSGREIVFTTTNGTKAIEVAKDCGQLFIGAFSNIDALIDKCLSTAERIVILCAGWNNKVNIEDTLFGGAFVEKLSKKIEVFFESDAVRMALKLWNLAKDDPIKFVKSSDHYKRLVDNDAESDAAFCFMKNTVPLVPVYEKTNGKLKI
ncbi:MAG: 2-phosphosulfolactate phosphatase [Petrimonas sp.]|jgi:2-phosphosulfolactate phosphatase